MNDPGFWLLIAATIAAGLAAGIVVTLIYLADKHDREVVDPVWADFFATGVAPRRHRRAFRHH